MEIQEVADLLDLNQGNFPAFPEIPEGRTLLCCDTEWQNTEKEFAAGCIVNACIKAGKWQPVHVQQFADQMKTNPMIAPFVVQGVANALWSLVSDGFIEAVHYQGANHFIPTPRLANAVLADPGKLRVV